MKRKTSRKKAGRSSTDPSNLFTTKRSIYVKGEIDESLFQTLAPQILRLTERSSQPITLLIDSRGGSIEYAARILGLLRAPVHGRPRPHIITVAIGDACSAAADILSEGDYVVAFRHARLLFHGTRAIREVSRENVEAIEGALELEDVRAARRLAVSVFRRFLSLYAQHSEQVAAAFRNAHQNGNEEQDLTDKRVVDVAALIGVLRRRIGGSAGEVLNRALDEMQRIKGILKLYKAFVENKVASPIYQLDKPNAGRDRKEWRMQLRVLEAVVAARLSGDGGRDLRAGSFRVLEGDFLQVLALADGSWEDELLDLLLEHDGLFFSAKDQARIAAMRALTLKQFDDSDDAQAQLSGAVGRAYRKAEPLWQYVTTLCRLLNDGEHEMGPEEAWYMGLIDEVIGYPLAHRRRDAREAVLIQRSLDLADVQKFV